MRRFAADGFRRTSVSDIAREAGLTPAAAYAYFAGKEGLFQAAVDADAGALIEGARSAGAKAHRRASSFSSSSASFASGSTTIRWRGGCSPGSSPRSPPAC